MARGQAYCVELGQDLTLQEAHRAYFDLPDDARKRFTFMCGDPKCRAVARPKVVGALYDRVDAFDAVAIASGRHRAPYFRSHVSFPHIDGCTWHEPATEERTKEPTTRPDETVNAGPLGLIWLPEAQERKRRDGGGRERTTSDDDDEEATDERPVRPDSTRFLSVVGMRCLTTSKTEQQNIPLRIGRQGAQRSLYDTCLPIEFFHPHFQTERIYFGMATIVELDHVFILTFLRRFAPSGEKTARKTIAKIKFLKRTLDEEDRQLGEVLRKAATEGERVHCFVYATEPPELKQHGTEQRGWFTYEKPDHIFVVPVSMVTATERANDV